MAIVNMLIRPITTYIIFKMMQDRSRSCDGSNFQEGLQGILIGTGNNRNGNYQDIGRPLASSTKASEISSPQLN